LEVTVTAGLRERQKALARDTILSAAADQIAEVGLIEFSIPDIARRAGVSQRTVYNYFANRRELIESLNDWINERLLERGGYNSVDSLDLLPTAVEANFLLFSEMGDLTRAFAKADDSAYEAVADDRSQRTAVFVNLAEEEFPGLPRERARAIGALLRSLCGSKNWYQLTNSLGLEPEEAASVTAWAAGALIEAARKEGTSA
jgi:AcrR family transcriptional regulator